VSQHNLLHHRQPQSGARFVGGKIRLEDLAALLRRHPRAVVPDFDPRFRCSLFFRKHLHFPLRLDRLDRVKQQVE